MTAETYPIELTINGKPVKAEVEARLSLVDFLRHHRHLTGTHVGCSHGVCGACTVIVDGRTARSCIMFAVQADGRSVRTVEGLAEGDKLSPLQEEFRNHHALQCGYCMLMSATALLEETPRPDEAQIRLALAGNLCRCTGYVNIIRAVKAASER
jgi:aerobic-type carbon monoxide dehydrogenase small subunit (CoxS/CutS family)